MSRLIDKFQKAAKSSVQPMGFRTARSAPAEPSIMLILSFTMEGLKSHTDTRNADAVLIRPNDAPVTEANVKKIAETIPDTPTGIYMEDTGDNEIAAMNKAGADFIVFPVSSRISAPQDENKTGRILQVESAMDDSLLRAVNSLPVDAVLTADTFEGGALVWHELMIFQHLANTLAKPLIVKIPANITEAELKALWEAGIDGILVEADKLKTNELKELQKFIGKLPPRSKRKRGKTDVTLPHSSKETAIATPPDEEEEENE
jgi:hypothetical protein